MSGSAALRFPGCIRAEYVVRPEEVSFSNGLFKAMDIFAQRDEINRRVAQDTGVNVPAWAGKD